MSKITLDTSALVRFFTSDDNQKAKKVKKLLKKQQLELFIPNVVFPELEYVLLSKTYDANRNKIAKAFEFLTAQKNITVSIAIKKAVTLYRATKLDMADCLIAAQTIKSKGKLASFDGELLNIEEVKSYWPVTKP